MGILEKMTNESMARFGSPLSPDGALYFMQGREGVVQCWADICKTAMQLTGMQITPAIEAEILDIVRKKADELDREIYAENIPIKMKSLFQIKKKAEAVAYCKKLELSEHDLFLLIHNCHQIGFIHRSKFREYLPQHLRVQESDISNMRAGNPHRFFNKVHGIFKERKRIHVHLLERGNEWHCFYYSYSDIKTGNRNHWKLGSHLHYISYLWPDLKKGQVWKSFDKREVEIQGSAHIKLQPFNSNPSHRIG